MGVFLAKKNQFADAMCALPLLCIPKKLSKKKAIETNIPQSIGIL
jgi:hypothetical protein